MVLSFFQYLSKVAYLSSFQNVSKFAYLEQLNGWIVNRVS